MSAPETVGRGDHHLVVSDWSILQPEDLVYVYLEGRLRFDVAQVVKTASRNKVTYRSPETGKAGYVDEQNRTDPSKGDQVALVGA